MVFVEMILNSHLIRKNLATCLTCVHQPIIRLHFAAFVILTLATLFVQPVNAQLTDRTVLIMGDSLAAAYGIAKKDGWGYLLEDRLDDAYPETDWQVINASVSGETTAGGLRRLVPLLANNAVDVCVLALGANDGLNGLPLTQMRSNLATMIDSCQAEGARVVMLGIKLPPNYGNAYTAQFESIYTDLVAEYQIPLEPFYLKDIIFRDGYMLEDRLHPSAIAQPVILETVWETLKPVLDEVVDTKTAPLDQAASR